MDGQQHITSLIMARKDGDVEANRLFCCPPSPTTLTIAGCRVWCSAQIIGICSSGPRSIEEDIHDFRRPSLGLLSEPKTGVMRLIELVQSRSVRFGRRRGRPIGLSVIWPRFHFLLPPRRRSRRPLAHVPRIAEGISCQKRRLGEMGRGGREGGRQGE